LRPTREVGLIPAIKYALTVNGMAVVTAPEEIDVTTAEQLRMALLDAGSHGHATVVVDMTHTQFCDSAGLGVLIRAHRRALGEGGELRLVLPAEGAAVRVLTLTRLDRLIPSFDSLGQALASVPASPAEGMLQASVEAGESGPVIVLAGEADQTCAEQLDTLIAGQLAGGTRQVTIDASGLRFADSASVRTLVLAARTLTERGGRLVLLDPQQSVARVLALLGADQMITIGRKTPTMEHGEPHS
jgi:anti-sigma B factor antagonist